MKVPAYKARIKWIQDGEYVENDGWNSSYVMTKFGEKISRARILSTIVDKYIAEDKSYGILTMDDGSDTITARAFKEETAKFEEINPGDILDIVGRVREYRGERYLMPETIRKIDDPNFESLRDLELIQIERKHKPENKKDMKKGENKKDVEERDAKREVVRIISEMDSGDGVSHAILNEKLKYGEEEIENAVKELLNKGEIYEPRVGIYRRA